MPVYVSDNTPCTPSTTWPYPSFAHLVADSLPELIDFALELGLNLSWLHKPRLSPPHFDLNPPRRFRAIAHGAKPLSRSKLASLRRAYRAANKLTDRK